jgi:hypothetical protein
MLGGVEVELDGSFDEITVEVKGVSLAGAGTRSDSEGKPWRMITRRGATVGQVKDMLWGGRALRVVGRGRRRR